MLTHTALLQLSIPLKWAVQGCLDGVTAHRLQVIPHARSGGPPYESQGIPLLLCCLLPPSVALLWLCCCVGVEVGVGHGHEDGVGVGRKLCTHPLLDCHGFGSLSPLLLPFPPLPLPSSPPLLLPPLLLPSPPLPSSFSSPPFLLLPFPPPPLPSSSPSL